MQINPGGDIPEESYLSNLMESNKEEMERVVVGRGSSHLISHHVDTPGSILRYIHSNVFVNSTSHAAYFYYSTNRWDFMSTDHDISYGWYLKSEDGKKDVEVVHSTVSYYISVNMVSVKDLVMGLSAGASTEDKEPYHSREWSTRM